VPYYMAVLIFVGTKSSPGLLINHLRWHPEQYQELMKKKDEVEAKVSSCMTTTNNFLIGFKLIIIKEILQDTFHLVGCRAMYATYRR
jgi:hypothetical protein